MSELLKVIDSSAVGDGQMVEAKVDGHDLLVARVDGAVYIADNHCPHLHASLSKGSLEGTIVTCPLHHSQFDLTDGHVVRWTDWKGAVKSMGELVRHARPLRVYETLERDGAIWVGEQKPPIEQNSD